MKKIFFKLKSKQKQSGIALIFALAMLSLLLIMAIGFATSAIFEQKAATNSASTSNARIMAQSALNRVLTLLNVYGERIQYSHDGAANSADMLSHLTTTLNGAPFYTWNAADPVEWEYLKVDDGTNNRLVGRFAYKVITVAGLDPGSLVNQAVNEAAVTAAEQRLGLYVDEINIKSVSPDIVAASPTATQVAAQKFNYTTCATPGLYPGPVPAAGWKNFKNLFTLTGVTDATLQSKLQRWFMLDTDRSKSKEQYRIDQPAATFYHRFNLARSWSAADFPVAYPPTAMYEKILLDKNPTTSPGPDGIPDQMPTVFPASYSPVDRTDGYGIPWLAFFGYKTDGTLDLTQGATFGSTAAGVAARRRQIAANLVDYCRTDTDPPAILPTSDVDPATWLTSAAPTFTGNKKTPYINELGFHVMVELVQTAVNGTNGKGKGKGKGKGNKNTTSKNIISLAVDVEAVAELVDIYGVTLPAADSTVTVDYTFSYNVTGAAAPSGTLSTSGTVIIPVAKTDWVTGNHYATPAAWVSLTLPAAVSDPIVNASISAGTNPNISVNNITFKINNVVLNYNGKNYDYAYINTAPAAVTAAIAVATNTTDTVDKDYFISFQANDPRQNLNPGDWTVTQTAVITDGTWDVAQYNTLTGGGTLDKLNNCLTSATGLDLEAGTDPAGAARASTAYIRQGPMQSPWELGFIHRGKAWETINLKQFDTAKSFLYVAGTPNIIPGGAAYAAGDANILNQVKMNGTLDNFKVNINSLYKDPDTAKYTVLEALFTNIKTGCTDKSAPAATLNMLSAADITSLVTVITNKTKTAPYTNRAQVVNDIVAVAPILNYTTDAAKEELIGKFINLTDVGGKYFYVIVLAQAIKDIGGPSSGTSATDIIIRKKKSDGTVISIPTRLGQFDCAPASNIYADEIVGEQKIRILVYLESTFNLPRILSYEYVE